VRQIRKLLLRSQDCRQCGRQIIAKQMNSGGQREQFLQKPATRQDDVGLEVDVADGPVNRFHAGDVVVKQRLQPLAGCFCRAEPPTTLVEKLRAFHQPRQPLVVQKSEVGDELLDRLGILLG
jgi:hypothetical protein